MEIGKIAQEGNITAFKHPSLGIVGKCVSPGYPLGLYLVAVGYSLFSQFSPVVPADHLKVTVVHRVGQLFYGNGGKALPQWCVAGNIGGNLPGEGMTENGDTHGLVLSGGAGVEVEAYHDSVVGIQVLYVVIHGDHFLGGQYGKPQGSEEGYDTSQAYGQKDPAPVNIQHFFPDVHVHPPTFLLRRANYARRRR